MPDCWMAGGKTLPGLVQEKRCLNFRFFQVLKTLQARSAGRGVAEYAAQC